MQLSSENVQTLVSECLAGSADAPDLVKVEGVVDNSGFLGQRLEARRSDIWSMLEQLDDKFMMEKGGGWTFLNLCTDKSGNQWTGLHTICGDLCCLAIGAKLGKWLLPREMWPALPGGMPYIGFSRTAFIPLTTSSSKTGPALKSKALRGDRSRAHA